MSIKLGANVFKWDKRLFIKFTQGLKQRLKIKDHIQLYFKGDKGDKIELNNWGDLLREWLPK